MLVGRGLERSDQKNKSTFKISSLELVKIDMSVTSFKPLFQTFTEIEEVGEKGELEGPDEKISRY